MPESSPHGPRPENPPPEGILESDYHLIEDAVMETARGRWFLREYALRIRKAEIAQVLEAIARVEAVVAGGQLSDPPGTASTMQGQSSADAAQETLKAVQEKLLDIAWCMRERGFDGRLCTAITKEAGKLFKLVSGEEPRREEHSRQDGDAAAHTISSAEPKAESPAADACAVGPPPDTIPVHASTGAPEAEKQTRAGKVADHRVKPLDTPLPSKVAALAQKASPFAAIDALPMRERLGFFS